MLSEVAITPDRMHLVDLASGEDYEVMFNPEQIQEELQVVYARQAVPGLSHQPLHYSYTSNEQVALDLFAVGDTPEERLIVEDFRRFLKSLCYPRGNAGTIDDGAPPRVLFVWPHVWTWTSVVTSLRIVSTQFTLRGRIVRFTASLMLEEIRDVRLTSEEVRRSGTRRSASGGGIESS